MKIAANYKNSPNNGINFCATQSGSKDDDKNPISKLGERETLLKAAVIAGLGFGVNALWYLADDTFVLEDTFNMSRKLVDKNKKGLTGVRRSVTHLGAWAALCAGFVALMAVGYTMVKTPEVMYNGKVNAFKKGKDMNVYIKGNKVEKELYNQLNDKAKDASVEEKEVLSQQYLKLKAAKNQTPDFVNKN